MPLALKCKNMGALKAGIFTTELTNSTLTITQSMGVRVISIYNGTSTAGTVTGDQKLGSTASSAINVTEGMTYTVAGNEASTIQSLTIVAPAGCTLKITAQV